MGDRYVDAVDDRRAAPRDREVPRERRSIFRRDDATTRAPATAGAPVTAEGVRATRVRQRAEYGGVAFGAVFFGWFVAIGMAVLLTAIVSAAGAALALTKLNASEATANADTIGVAGGALLVVVLLLAYFAGGYVAGRMARFDGGRQGFGVWLFGLLITLLLAAAGAIAGSQYNVFGKLNLPRIPVDEGSLTAGGAIALGLILIGTLIAAILGGKLGNRYHRRVDAAALDV